LNCSFKILGGESGRDGEASTFLAEGVPGDFHKIRSVPALKHLLANAGTLLIDVRTPAEYEAGHIAGAINMPLNSLGRHVAEIPPDQAMVLYCSSGYRSAMGVMALQLEGRYRVQGFPPSIEGWKAAGEPVVSTGDAEVGRPA